VDRLPPEPADLQDGILAYYLSVAGQSDANVERALDSNFDFRDLRPKAQPDRPEGGG
jgi:hypothetical protein